MAAGKASTTDCLSAAMAENPSSRPNASASSTSSFQLKVGSKPACQDNATRNGKNSAVSSASRKALIWKPSHHISIVMSSGRPKITAPAKARASPCANWRSGLSAAAAIGGWPAWCEPGLAGRKRGNVHRQPGGYPVRGTNRQPRAAAVPALSGGEWAAVARRCARAGGGT